MSRTLLAILGSIFMIVFVASCSGHTATNNHSSAPDTYRSFDANDGMTVEQQFDDSLPIEEEHPEESIEVEIPSQLAGSVEDEALSINMQAELQSDGTNYMTNIEFHNKSGKSLDLIFDCGLLISNDQFASNSGECVAVESMLLKKNKRELVSVALSREFFDHADGVITIRYRQVGITKDLELKLEVY